MPAAGYNETDTRAKLIDPALYAAQWVEQVDEAQRTSHGEIHREQSAVRIDIMDGKPLKRGPAADDGRKNSDGGQFYTPREMIRAMVHIADPQIGQTVCDPCCGAGGFLAESAVHMQRQAGEPRNRS